MLSLYWRAKHEKYLRFFVLRFLHDKLRFCMTGKRVSSWTRITNFLVIPDKHDKSRSLPDPDDILASDRPSPCCVFSRSTCTGRCCSSPCCRLCTTDRGGTPTSSSSPTATGYEKRPGFGRRVRRKLRCSHAKVAGIWRIGFVSIVLKKVVFCCAAV